MASGLFHRQAPTTRAAGDHAMPEDVLPEDSTAADATTADRRFTDTTASAPSTTGATGVSGVSDTTIPRHRLAPGQTVAPGGAVAPVPPGGAVAPVAPVTDRDRIERDRIDPDHTEVITEQERVDAAESDHVEPVRRARTSFTATLSLILGVCATLAALSGRLAPPAVAIGVVGLIFAAAGLAAVARRHVTGHHVALLGLAFSIAGVVLGILAINKSLPWLDGGADQAARLRDWLDAHMSWMRNM